MKNKTCKTCQTNKPVSCFYRCSVLKDGYENTCKECRLQIRKSFQNNRIEAQSFEVVTEKKCFACGDTKAVTDFWKDSSRKDGFTPKCKPCVNKANNESAHRHPETAKRKWQRNYKNHTDRYTAKAKSRRATLRNIEGKFTAQDIKNLYQKQKGVCLYCSKSLEFEKHVDHIIPISKGGSNFPSNLQLLCPACNLWKSDKLPSELNAIANTRNQALKP